MLAKRYYEEAAICGSLSFCIKPMSGSNDYNLGNTYAPNANPLRNSHSRHAIQTRAPRLDFPTTNSVDLGSSTSLSGERDPKGPDRDGPWGEQPRDLVDFDFGDHLVGALSDGVFGSPGCPLRLE